jgi:nitroreductase
MPETRLLHELIASRWIPRAITAEAIDPAKLRSLYEAARSSASCFNEQPWRFILATKDHPEHFERVLKLLAAKNQEWAKTAFALGISAGKRTFTLTGAPDRFGLHDTGAALANLMIQATAVGLHVHAMGGFDAERARAEFNIPDDFEVGAAFAIGHVDGPPEPPVNRTRRSLSEVVFSVQWDLPFSWDADEPSDGGV